MNTVQTYRTTLLRSKRKSYIQSVRAATFSYFRKICLYSVCLRQLSKQTHWIKVELHAFGFTLCVIHIQIHLLVYCFTGIHSFLKWLCNLFCFVCIHHSHLNQMLIESYSQQSHITFCVYVLLLQKYLWKSLRSCLAWSGLGNGIHQRTINESNNSNNNNNNWNGKDKAQLR